MAILDDVQLESLRLKHGGKIGILPWDGHQLVFRRPSRDAARMYAIKKAEVDLDAIDQLAQQTLVAFDGMTDPVETIRYSFGALLIEYPLMMMSNSARVIFAHLVGVVERDDELEMGKGVSVRSAAPKRTPAASLTGSAASFAASLSPTTDSSPQS